jgi:hypothetical protein
MRVHFPLGRSGATRWHIDVNKQGISYGDQSAGYGEPIAPMAVVKCGAERRGQKRKGELRTFITERASRGGGQGLEGEGGVPVI